MSRKLVLLGMMAKTPVPGVVWQTVHYLVGLRRLGFDVTYVEAHARTPAMLMRSSSEDGAALAAGFIDETLRRFDLGDRWAYHALHSDGRCYGMSAAALARRYREAELIINLHGATQPSPELADDGKLVYLETDPVALQIDLHDGSQQAHEFLAAHSAHFTFAENLGRPGCELPASERFPFLPTRQPVVLDFWERSGGDDAELFTTVGNWRQPWRAVHYRGERLSWTKDEQWRAFLDLPRRTAQPFELALSGTKPHHVRELRKRGWRVRDALAFGSDARAYRDYIAGSRAELTVAKEQNVRLRTGWFSDRSATYLAAGRPVVTQDTAFDAVLPTGAGLFAVDSVEAAAAAVEEINNDYARHREAARAIAREHFDAERVLGVLLEQCDVTTRRPTPMTPRKDADLPTPARHRLSPDSSVLALIPHFKCEEYLDDCLQSLVEQTRRLDGIVVIDDASEAPPTRLVQRYPQVTLLHADRKSGPYRLVQQVIEETDYDAYLFQDADDWSDPARLEILLRAGAQTGGELIGTQEVRVFCDEPEVSPIAWPLDAKAPFAEKPTAFPLLHPTSIVTRDLVMALGGFASGLPFSGDAEFLRRARFTAEIVNVPEHLYFRRIRQGSLTTAVATGLQSPERKRVMEMLWARARANAELVAEGREPDLSPIAVAPPVGLRRLAGPALRGQGATPAPRRPRPVAPAPHADAPVQPVFVIGAERSGASALACALGQHPQIAGAHDGGWLDELAPALEGISDAALAARIAQAAADFAARGRPLIVDAAWTRTGMIEHLATLFPQARFIHIARDEEAVVDLLVNPRLGAAGATGGTQIPERLRTKVDEPAARASWAAADAACRAAAERLGEERVLRVPFAELVGNPEALVRRSLAFLGAEYSQECLRPLRQLRARGVQAPTAEVGVNGRRSAPGAAPRPAAPSGRIVLVTDHFPKFSETFFAREFSELRERGWDVHVLCNRSNKDQWPYFPALKDELERRERIHVVRDFEAQIKELAPDIVHFGYGTLARERMHVRELVGCKVAVSFRGYDINYAGLEVAGYYDDVWASADMLHVVSGDIWRRAVRRGCPRDKPHVVITDAADVSAFSAPQRRYEAAGTADRPLRIASVGRLVWKKGYEHALTAVRRLVDRGVHVEYRIVGEGPHREPIVFAIHDLRLDDHVKLLGALDAPDVRDTLAWADVCLQASVSEGFCVSVIEAQAMGLPVVCSDADGLGENVEHEVTGFVVPRRNVPALTERLLALAGDRDLRERMGVAARRRAEQQFDIGRQLSELDAMYRTLLAAPKPAAEAPPRRRAAEDALTELERQQAGLERRREALAKEIRGRRVVQRVHRDVERLLPLGAHVAVVSRGDDALVELGGREAWHFPRIPDGRWAGEYPADDAAAIAHLDELRALGAEYLVIPATSAWWLEHYEGFAAHLNAHGSQLLADAESCTIFALAPAAVASPDRRKVVA